AGAGGWGRGGDGHGGGAGDRPGGAGAGDAFGPDVGAAARLDGEGHGSRGGGGIQGVLRSSKGSRAARNSRPAGPERRARSRQGEKAPPAAGGSDLLRPDSSCHAGDASQPGT